MSRWAKAGKPLSNARGERQRARASIRLASLTPASSESTAATTRLAGAIARRRGRVARSDGYSAHRPVLRNACGPPPGVELEVAQRIDGALGEDERAVRRPSRALPGALGAPGRKSGKAPVLDLEARDRAGAGRVNEEVYLPRRPVPTSPQSADAKGSRDECLVY